MANHVLRVLSLPGRNFKGNNPYFRLFCDSLEDAGIEVIDIKSAKAFLGRFDVVHVHFPEHYVTEQSLPNAIKWTAFYTCLFLLSRALGRIIIWNVHDVLPFKERHVWLLNPYMKIFRRLVSGHVFMSKSSREEFLLHFPSLAAKPSCMIHHGPFPIGEIDEGVVLEKRHALAAEPGDFLLGFLGNIKAYKNVGALKSVPRALANGRRVKILVAGSADGESKEELEATLAVAGAERVIRLDKQLSDEELNLFIRAVDVVFLPYKKGWNSGLAVLVLCNQGRLLGSELPIFSDISEQFGAPWVYQYRSLSELPAIFEEMSSRAVTQEDKARLSALLQATDFGISAEVLKAFYRSFPHSGGPAMLAT